MGTKHYSLNRKNPLSERDVEYLKEKAGELNIEIVSMKDALSFQRRIDYIPPVEEPREVYPNDQNKSSPSLNSLLEPQSVKMLTEIHNLLFLKKLPNNPTSYVEGLKAKIILDSALKHKRR